MKQIQYIYEDADSFRKKLAEVRAESKQINASNTLIHIFSTNTDKELIKRLCFAIENDFPEAVYIGCTTNSNIVDGKFNEDCISIAFSLFTDPGTRIDIWHQPLEGYSAKQMLDTVPQIRSEFRNVKAIEALVSSYGMMESNLTKSFADFKPDGKLLFGGGAYTGDSNSDSFVFAKGWAPDNKSLVIVLYSGDALHFDARHISGWRPLGRSFSVTSVEGNVLKTLDNKPAFEVYSQYLGIENDDSFQSNSIEFPFMCRTDDGKNILRTPVSSNPDGSIVMFSEIDNFDTVRLSYGNKSFISDRIVREAQSLCEFRPDSIELFSCVARRAFWADDIDRESSIFQKIAPTNGFYTSGELMTENEKLYHYNETLLIVAIREGEPKRNIPNLDAEAISKSSKSFDRKLAQFISTATTELEQTNRELDEMVKDVENSRRIAEEANLAKSNFLANMSHEIRTPINAILGFDTMILRESGNKAIIKYANNIMRAGSNLLTIINDILDLSKIESGKMNIVNVEYELSSLILDVVNMMTMKAEEKGLRVSVDVDTDIPSWLYGDDVRIRQVIVNLMNNAVKYTETESIALAIKGTREGEYEILHVEVRDTGMGIKPEDMDKLFEKFARIEEEKNHNVEGTGLGMNITINLLSMMDSKLNVESEYEKGSCFSFDIKQKVVREEPIGDIGKRSMEYHGETSYSSSFTAPDANILVVDDNTMNREVIIGLLSDTKIHFDQADGGLVCLEKTAQAKYDLILLDHMMPDLDGIKTLQRIREDKDNPNRETTIICMTANAITGAKEEYLDAGFDAYISKPVKPDSLERMLIKRLPPELVVMADRNAVSSVNDDCSDNESDTATQNPNSDLLAEASQISGIDIETAMSNLASEDRVLHTMKIFLTASDVEADYLLNCLDRINDVNSSAKEINQAVEEYRIKVHSMKSTSLTIGAVMVSNMAKFLEFSAKDNNLENIKSVTIPFINEWKALTSRMKEVLMKPDAETVPVDVSNCDKNKISGLLDELVTTVNNMDIDSADEIVSTLEKEGLAAIDAKEFGLLKQAVLNIDLDSTGDSVGRLQNTLKN